MKTLMLLLTLTLGWTTIVHADDPFPYDPTCRSFGATSETVTLTSSGKTVVLCHFRASSYIEKYTLNESWGGLSNALAVQAYKQKGSSFGGDCSQWNAWVYSAKNSQGNNFQLCVFADNSIMEEQTFRDGPGGFNSEMDWALGIQ